MLGFTLRLDWTKIIDERKYTYMNKKEPSRVVSGYFRVKDKSKEEIQSMFSAAIDNGINFFDHADKYGGDHVCESRFGESIRITSYNVCYTKLLRSERTCSRRHNNDYTLMQGLCQYNHPFF